MSRLAPLRDVWFVEEALHTEGEPAIEVEEVAPGLRVCRPMLPSCDRGFAPEQQESLERLVAPVLAQANVRDFIAWTYTPMAARLALALEPRALVYDCMDELTAFLNAPAELIAMERELLGRADLVFTGGPSLYRAKRALHGNVHCFPSSVDVDHFARAAHTPEASYQVGLPQPRLGYFGVIDERMDLDVLRALAETHPEWQILMVGPVVKIDPATLPAAPNLHYLGQRPYDELPAYLAGWDVCLMPFAIREATKFISPTKVLEYMAADRPIVSTPITDVVEPYGDIVYLGNGPQGFVTACQRALAAGASERQERRRRADRVLDRTSWDDTVRRMDQLLREVGGEAAVPAVAGASAGLAAAREGRA